MSTAIIKSLRANPYLTSPWCLEFKICKISPIHYFSTWLSHLARSWPPFMTLVFFALPPLAHNFPVGNGQLSTKSSFSRVFTAKNLCQRGTEWFQPERESVKGYEQCSLVSWGLVHSCSASLLCTQTPFPLPRLVAPAAAQCCQQLD